jgi:hypothetical protein
MKISQESDFVGKGLSDSFQPLARVNPGEDLSKVTHFLKLNVSEGVTN